MSEPFTLEQDKFSNAVRAFLEHAPGAIVSRCAEAGATFENALIQALKAYGALSTLPQPAGEMGDGWVLVPREATEEMRLHGAAALDSENYPNDAGYAASCYRAMIAAAPTPPPVSDDWARKVITDVAELPDRTSPEDAPDMMLVTADELTALIQRHAPVAGMGLTPEEREAVEKARQFLSQHPFPFSDERSLCDLLSIIDRLAGSKKE